MLLTITTDWIAALTAIGQLLITAVGFWLLYTTFVLQAKVAVDQQKMLDIENRRARREIRPVFKINGKYALVNVNFTRFEFYCDLNDAYNVHWCSKSGENVSLYEDCITIEFVKKEALYSIDYTFLRPPNNKYSPEFKIVIELSFEDVDGYPYTQILSGAHCELMPGRPIPAW